MNERAQVDIASEMRGDARSHERLRWRSRPCAQCHGGLTALSYILSRPEASSGVYPDPTEPPETIAAREVSWLLEWVGGCDHRSPSDANLPRIAEGSEHIVLFDENNGDAKVIKYTRPNIYGESYYIDNGVVNQKNCAPHEYLIRMMLWKKLFISAPTVLGITETGQIVSSQDFIDGRKPSQQSVDSFLKESGFTCERQSCWIWRRAYPEYEIWVGDARVDNFVENDAGIVPIDIRLWYGPEPESETNTDADA